MVCIDRIICLGDRNYPTIIYEIVIIILEEGIVR